MITKKQILALKFLIFKSEDAESFAKKICFLLIEQTNLLIKPVCISFNESEEFSADFIKKNILLSTDFLYSTSGRTHINAVLDAMGSKFHFSHDNGYFDESGVWLHGGERSWTIFLSPFPPVLDEKDKIFKIKATLKEIENIKINEALKYFGY